METIETERSDRKVHTFFCDGCGKELGSSVEYDDGYYENCGEYEQKFYINGWHTIRANYCEECEKKKNQEIVSALKAIGFFKEKH